MFTKIQKVAGIFGAMAVSFLNLFYYIQVATDSSEILYWFLALISPTGFALGMDTVKLFNYFLMISQFSENPADYSPLENQSINKCAILLQALYLEITTPNGVTWDTLWEGAGLPFAGAYVMLSVDIVLYFFLAYYLDNVLPSKLILAK